MYAKALGYERALRTIGYEYREWGTYIEWCKRDFGNARYVGVVTELKPIPALVLGEAIQIPSPDYGSYREDELRSTNWIEVLYGEQRLVVEEERFEAL